MTAEERQSAGVCDFFGNCFLASVQKAYLDEHDKELTGRFVSRQGRGKLLEDRVELLRLGEELVIAPHQDEARIAPFLAALSAWEGESDIVETDSGKRCNGPGAGLHLNRVPTAPM